MEEHIVFAFLGWVYLILCCHHSAPSHTSLLILSVFFNCSRANRHETVLLVILPSISLMVSEAEHPSL